MMVFSWSYTPRAIPLFAGTIVLLWVAVMAWRRRHVPGAAYLSMVGVSLAVATAAYGFELGATGIREVHLTYQLYYLGTLTHGIFLPLMLLDFLGRRDLITRRNVILLAAVPLISLVLAWTNDWHMLIWQNIRIDRGMGYTASAFDRGDLYFLPNGYGLLLLLAMLTFLARAWTQAAAGHRFPILLMMIGMLLPNLAFALYLVKLAPPGTYLEPYTFFAGASIYAAGMFWRKMFEVQPIMHRSIYQILPNPIFIFDSQGRLADINPAAEELFGLDAHHCIGMKGSAMLAPWPPMVELYNHPVDADVVQRVMIGGRERNLQVRTLRLRSRSGAPSGYAMVVRDITREVQAEEAQRLSNARLLVLHQVDNELNLKLDVDYVASVALDAAILLSHADAALIGFAQGDEVTALKVTGLYGEDIIGTRIDQEGITGRALRNRAPEWVRDVKEDPDYIRRIPGTKSLMAVPLMAGSELIGIIAVETESPERFTMSVFESIQLLATRVATALDNARAYEERDQLVGELGAFAHTVAHDLKSPIGVIAGYAEILADRHDTMPKEQAADILTTIQERSMKMVTIIDSLLMLASVRGVAGVDIAPLDMMAIVRDVLHRLDPMIAEKHAAITIAPSWPGAVGYAPWVEEILVNYVSNALKYGGTPPQIDIRARRLKNNMIRFNVRDNGPGMSKKDSARLFTPFTRLEAARRTDGHGLGLSIVERIATRLGGEAGVESRLGRGSTFYFTLPADTQTREQHAQ